MTIHILNREISSNLSKGLRLPMTRDLPGDKQAVVEGGGAERVTAQYLSSPHVGVLAPQKMKHAGFWQAKILATNYTNEHEVIQKKFVTIRESSGRFSGLSSYKYWFTAH